MYFQVPLFAQDHCELARIAFQENALEKARYHADKALSQKALDPCYFLSGLIYEAQGKDLRALADYEVVVRRDPENLEAFFQKGIIYHKTAGYEQAIKDFSWVLEHIDRSETQVVYFGYDPLNVKGTFMTTLQSMKGRVYQYRAMSLQKLERYEEALSDFSHSFEYDTTAEFLINRALLYSQLGRQSLAVADLTIAIELEPSNDLAWYNLLLLDRTTELPEELLGNEDFYPLMNLLGSNAHEGGNYKAAIRYFSAAIRANSADHFSWIGRGKSFLKTQQYDLARRDFIEALHVDPQGIEGLFLIGNSLYAEGNYSEALGFYEQYLSVDTGYDKVWFNAAMAYLSTKSKAKGCECLGKAAALGMEQASVLIDKHCTKQ